MIFYQLKNATVGRGIHRLVRPQRCVLCWELGSDGAGPCAQGHVVSAALWRMFASTDTKFIPSRTELSYEMVVDPRMRDPNFCRDLLCYDCEHLAGSVWENELAQYLADGEAKGGLRGSRVRLAVLSLLFRIILVHDSAFNKETAALLHLIRRELVLSRNSPHVFTRHEISVRLFFPRAR